jgi:hypothetical protein
MLCYGPLWGLRFDKTRQAAIVKEKVTQYTTTALGIPWFKIHMHGKTWPTDGGKLRVGQYFHFHLHPHRRSLEVGGPGLAAETGFTDPLADSKELPTLFPSRGFPAMAPKSRPIRIGARGAGFGSDNFTRTPQSGSDNFRLAPDFGAHIDRLRGGGWSVSWSAVIKMILWHFQVTPF